MASGGAAFRWLGTQMICGAAERPAEGVPSVGDHSTPHALRSDISESLGLHWPAVSGSWTFVRVRAPVERVS